MASPVKEYRLKQEANGFTEHGVTPPGRGPGRGPGYLVSKMPGTNRYALNSQVGVAGWHIVGTETEIDTAWVDADPILDTPWQKKMVLADYNAYFAREATMSFDQGQLLEYRHPASGESVSFQPQALLWRVIIDGGSESQSTVANPQNVAAAINDDTLVFSGAYGSGLDFYWETQTTRLQKRLTVDSFSNLPAVPTWMTEPPWDVGAIYLALPFIIDHSIGVSIWIDGVEWDEKQNNPLTTGSFVEFRDASDNVLWVFEMPRAWDNDDMAPATYHFRSQGGSLFVEVRVLYSWLETAVYPVTVDPSVNPSVGASADDGHERANSTPDITATSVFMTSSSVAGFSYYAGWRFATSSITNGDTVDVCDIDVAFTTSSADNPNGTLYFEDTDDASAFTTTDDDIAGRTPTSTGAPWVELDPGLGAGWNTSPSLVTDAQEVVDRAGFSAGANVAVLWVANTDQASNAGVRSYDGNPSLAAVLYLEWTTGGGRIVSSMAAAGGLAGPGGLAGIGGGLAG